MPLLQVGRVPCHAMPCNAMPCIACSHGHLVAAIANSTNLEYI